MDNICYYNIYVYLCICMYIYIYMCMYICTRQLFFTNLGVIPLHSVLVTNISSDTIIRQ